MGNQISRDLHANANPILNLASCIFALLLCAIQAKHKYINK